MRGSTKTLCYDVHIFGEGGISQLPPVMACTLFLDHNANILRLLLTIFCQINFLKLLLFFSSVPTQPSWFLARGVLLPGPAGLLDTRSTTITSIFNCCILFRVDHRLLYLHIYLTSVYFTLQSTGQPLPPYTTHCSASGVRAG